VLARLDQRDLGWVGADGFPLAVPVAGVRRWTTASDCASGATCPRRRRPGLPDLPFAPGDVHRQENHLRRGALEHRLR
jgi:hypothetical protein